MRFESAGGPVQLRLRFGGVSPDGTSVRDEPFQQHEHLEHAW
jgi:hypothetical protein